MSDNETMVEVDIDEDVHKKLIERAEELGITIDELVEQILRSYIDGQTVEVADLATVIDEQGDDFFEKCWLITENGEPIARIVPIGGDYASDETEARDEEAAEEESEEESTSS
jgi:hypothetical protein